MINTRYGRPPEALEASIEKHFPQSQWENAASVSFLESSWRSEATADTRHLAGGECGGWYTLADGTPAQTEYSVGPWQINLCVHGIPEDQARDPDTATAFAAGLYFASGWRPWFLASRSLGILDGPIAEPGPPPETPETPSEAPEVPEEAPTLPQIPTGPILLSVDRVSCQGAILGLILFAGGILWTLSTLIT